MALGAPRFMFLTYPRLSSTFRYSPFPVPSSSVSRSTAMTCSLRCGQ